MYFSTDRTRKPLDQGEIVTIRNGNGQTERSYVIDRLAGQGGYSLLYIAHEKDDPTHWAALKEFFPSRVENAIVERREDNRIVIYDPMLESEKQDNEAIWAALERHFEREVQMSVKAGAVYDRTGARVDQNNSDVLHVSGPYRADNGNRYLVLDTYHGESLAAYINGGWMSEEERGKVANSRLASVLDILMQVTRKLSALHGDAKLYHLDLSTANIYLSLCNGGREFEPYIIDYGSAYLYDQREAADYSRHRFTCNPFSAPEVMALADLQSEECGYAVDASSDTYSIAGILFYALLGELYTVDLLFATGWKRRIRALYPERIYGDFADALIEFFRVGLAAGQADRFPTAKALLIALDNLAKMHENKGLLALIDPDERMSYLILHRYPLYEYADQSGEMNVLCLGGGVFVTRMILTMISTGQMIDKKLKIYVVTTDAEACRERLLNSAPELAIYSNLSGKMDNADQYVHFSFENTGDLLETKICQGIAKKYRHCRYVVISLGSNNRNVDLARSYASNLGEYSEEPTVIHYYMDEDAAMNTRSDVPTDCIPSHISLCSFSEREYAKDTRKLGQNAFCVHYLYAKLSDPHAARSDAVQAFAEDAYLQKSSAAAALHIRYKLASIGILPEHAQSDKAQITAKYYEALKKQKGRLLELEHRRWMMYMIADGYTLPDMKTIASYSFEWLDGAEFNRGFKCVSRRYHHCLLPCSNSGIILANLPRSEWDKYTSYEEIDATEFDPLDKVSLKVHLLAGQKLDRKRTRNNIMNIVDDNIAELIPSEEDELSAEFARFREWLTSALDHRNPTQIEAHLERLENAYARFGIGISHWCKKLADALSIYTEYNAYVDYKTPDETIIDHLRSVYYTDELFDSNNFLTK